MSPAENAIARPALPAAMVPNDLRKNCMQNSK